MWWHWVGKGEEGEEEGLRGWELLPQIPPLSNALEQLGKTWLGSSGLVVPGDSDLKILTPASLPPNMESGSGDWRSHASCPKNLGSRFSYLHFIDGDLRLKGKLVGMAAPNGPTPPLWLPVSTPSGLLETPTGHASQCKYGSFRGLGIPEGWGWERNPQLIHRETRSYH